MNHERDKFQASIKEGQYEILHNKIAPFFRRDCQGDVRSIQEGVRIWQVSFLPFLYLMHGFGTPRIIRGVFYFAAMKVNGEIFGAFGG